MNRKHIQVNIVLDVAEDWSVDAVMMAVERRFRSLENFSDGELKVVNLVGGQTV